jgi:hypothetical protein
VRRLIGEVVALLAVMLLVTAGVSARSPVWSYDHLIRRLDGRTVRVAGVPYTIDRALLVCNGAGRAVSAGGVRRWHRFTCTQTVFRPAVMRDVTFSVRVLDWRRCRLYDARYGP